MKSKNKTAQKVEAFFEKEMPAFANIWYVKDKNNYILFDKYIITKQEPDWQVKTRHTAPRAFSKSTSAASWAILHNLGQYRECFQIIYWDAKAAELGQKVSALQSQIAKAKVGDQRDSLAAKHSEAEYSAARARRELDKYVNIAKYWQTKGFNNEIARSCAKEKFKKHR